ncbi:unnamed protein product, partial [Durusdinium trenchii]
MERSANLRNAWASAKQLKESSPGYALRLGSFTVMAMAKTFVSPRIQAGAELNKHFEQICEGFSQCLQDLRDMRTTWNWRSRPRDKTSGRENALSEWLLAEQPQTVKPKFLVLTDCQPEQGHSEDVQDRIVDFKQLVDFAKRWSYILEAILCGAWLELCKVVAENTVRCWACLTRSPHEKAVGCNCLSQEPKSEIVTSACRRLWQAATSSAKVFQGKELKDTLQIYGQTAMTALGGSKRWQELNKLPEQSINFMTARLKALVPESPWRSLDADLTKEEVQDRAVEAARTQLDAMMSKGRPPELQEAFSVLEVLPFLRQDDRKDAQLKLNELHELLNKQEKNPVKWVIRAEMEDNIVKYFNIQWQVQMKLWEYWFNNQKYRKDRFMCLKPASVMYVLEKVVVWASVLLTQFDSLYLPQSFVQAHLTSAGHLARQAAEAPKEEADKWKADARRALKDVVHFLKSLIFWDLDFFQWLKKTEAHQGEVLARITSLLAATMVNDEQAKDEAINLWRNVKAVTLDIVKTVEHNCGNLPISLIRFFLDQEKKRDILMKSAAEVMGRLEDPLVCIWWRKDSKVEVRFLRGGVAWIERPPHWIRKALEKKSIREEVQRSMQNHYRLEWKRIRTVNVQGDWDPASSLATKRAARTKDTEAEPAEAEAAEAEAEEPAGVDEAVEERDREEEVDNAGATGEAFNEMSMGPSTEVEQNQLTPEEKEEILAKKTKKATMHTIWKSWNDEVQEAKREVSSEEQEHINARESMFGEMNLTAIQRIRYRASILPIRRRYAEEQERLQQLKKRLNDHDVGNIEEGLTDEQKKELINKALTGVGKLIKNSEDFLKLEVNKDVLGSNADPRKDKTTTAERRAVSFWLGRKKIFGLAYHERPTFEYKENMHQSCLPTLLRRLGLEEYLYPAWVMEQLQRRLSMARSSLASSGPEALDYRGAPILWGRRRVWDSRARNHNLETREKAVLLLSQIEEALTAAQSIHSEDPGAKDVDPEQPDEEDEEATSEIGERAEATNQPEDVEDISPEEKDVEPALRRDTQKEADHEETAKAAEDVEPALHRDTKKEADHEETAKAAEASMEVEAPTSPGGNAFGVAPVHAGADRAEEEEIDEADQAPSDTEVLEQTRQMEQNGELEKPGVVKEALEVETEDLAEGAEEIKQEVKVPVATPSTAASSTAAPTSPENHGLPPFEVLVEDTRSILKQILEMSDEQKEAHLACCGVPPFGPFLKKDMSEDELNEYSLFMAHSLMATKEAILRGAPRLSDIIEKINPLMLAEMHANFMAAKISKNEGSEGPRSPEMPGATEGFMTQFKEATGMVPSSAASSNAAPAIAENGGIRQFQVYLEGVMAEHEQMAALSEEERKAICEREGLPDFHGQWMAMDERERSKTMHAVAMRAMSQDMIFQEAQHQGIPWETLENSQTSPELAKKLLDDYMRRNQGSGGARSPEMSGAAEKLMAKGFKTHLKATEATHAGPKSQKTKMSQATERMMGKALIDSLKASTSTPEPVRPEVAVSLPDLHASAEEKQKAKAAKHAERRQKKLKVNEAVQKEDPGKEHAEWCEREKALRTDAFKLCDQLGKLLTQIAPRLDVAGQLKEKFDDALSMWFEHCDAVIDERRGTWTRKRRGHFEELEDAAEELEWWKFNSKSDHFMSLLKRGSTIIEKGAWAVHFAVEMLRSQSGALDEQLNPIVFEMTEEEDNAEEEEPEEPEGDMISSRAILKAMMTCFEHVEKAAELWKVGEKVEEEEVEEDGAASPSDRTALPAQAGLPDKDQEEDRPPPPATAEVDPHSQANGDKDGPPTPAQPEAASSSSKDPKEPRMKVCPACQEKVEQSRLKKHKSKECIMRVEECTVCQSRMSWKLLEEHKYECEGREVECPDCNNILIARQLPLHLETECPLRQVSCPNEAMGCDWRGPHEGLESHRLHCLADHQRRREEQQVAGVKAAPSQRELPPQHPAQGGYVDTFCAPEAPQPQATSSKSGVWPDDQEEEAREFARKHDLEWEMVRARFNSLNPPQREMIMRRFECPASHEPSGKFKNFVESCQKNGWWHCPSEAAWYQERALRRGTAVTAASSSMSQSSASPSRGAKAAPANFFVHDAIAKTKQEGEPLMKAPPATQEQFGIFKASSQAAAEAGAWSNYTPATTSQPQQTPDRVQEVMRKAPPMATQEDPWLNPEPKPAPPQPPMKSQ